MPDVVVIGGGPSGAVVSALLASWGHTVTLLTQAIDPSRGLVNSLPPSTHKILERVGILDLVRRVGFPTTGNTVWWGDDERVESFAGDGTVQGYQVFRPALDPLLLERAGVAGAQVITNATVTHAQTGDEPRVTYRVDDHERQLQARLVLDCSGRSGVIARQGWRRSPDVPMQALLGAWSRPGGWALGDEQHTSVETYDDGWAWTVPISATVRHTGVVIHGARSRLVRGKTLADTYAGELGKSRHLGAQVAGARLGDVWACDASIYASTNYAGPGFLLIGDAGSTIDPLSSFGVKKALTSAWLGAVAANTVLHDRSREALVTTFFSQWESQVYATHLGRSRAFAVEAFERHPSPFWEAQARMPIADGAAVDEHALLRDAAVAAALAEIKQQPELRLTRDEAIRWVEIGLVRDREIVAAAAVGIDEAQPIRFLSGVDLIALTEMAPAHTQVPELFEAYCQRCGTVRIVDLLGALSFLIARRVLHFARH